MKKTIITLMLTLIIGVLATGTAFAAEEKTSKEEVEVTSESGEEKSDDKKSDDKKSDDEKSDDEKSSDEKSSDDKSSDDTTEVTATADDYNITTGEDNTVTFLRADGTVMSGVNVTVKNTLSGADGDISRDEFSTDENGIFDYSAFIEDDVYILRITDSENGYSLEYVIESGEITIEAGKNKSGDGQSTSKTNTYMIIGGVVVIVILGVITAVVMAKQKKKKAEFAAKAKKKTEKKK